MSHETIKQHLLRVIQILIDRESLERPVLFVEVDGLDIKNQRKGKRKKGRKKKITAVHQGWIKSGKRVALKGGSGQAPTV